MTNYLYSYVLSGSTMTNNFQLCVLAFFIYFGFICLLGRLLGFNVLDEAN